MCVLLTYIDESYSKDWFFIAALACPADQVNDLGADLDGVVVKASQAYGIAPGTELHGYEIFHGKAEWTPMEKLHRARIAVYADAFRVIAGYDVHIILRGLDIGRHQARYAHPDPPHTVVLQHTVERVNDLARRHDELALVIADEVSGQDEHRAAFNEYRRVGTSGYRASTLTRLVDTIHFAPSHCSRLLQAVDMIAFMHHRRRTVLEQDARAGRANNELWNLIRPRVVHEHTWVP